MSLSPWKILKSTYLIKDRWLTLRADTCETGEGLLIDPFYILEKRDWAHVVGFDAQDRILVVRQYRHGSKSICVELPCGVIDESDASPLQAAKRELLEETGCKSAHYENLGSVYANPARQTNRVYAFLAFDVRQIAEPKLDATENIEFEFVNLSTLFQLIDSGAFSQSLHIASVFMALRKRNLLGSVPAKTTFPPEEKP